MRKCYICCKKELTKFAKDKNYENVRDHCHYTGKYRDAEHIICNLKSNLKARQFFIRVQIMIIILSLKN